MWWLYLNWAPTNHVLWYLFTVLSKYPDIKLGKLWRPELPTLVYHYTQNPMWYHDIKWKYQYCDVSICIAHCRQLVTEFIKAFLIDGINSRLPVCFIVSVSLIYLHTHIL